MCVLFFKQRTAYDMRISDWSSDVCSSDLRSIRPCTYWSNRRSTSGSKSLALALRSSLMSCLRFVDDANLAGGAERTRYGRGRPACLRSSGESLRHHCAARPSCSALLRGNAMIVHLPHRTDRLLLRTLRLSAVEAFHGYRSREDEIGRAHV